MILQPIRGEPVPRSPRLFLENNLRQYRDKSRRKKNSEVNGDDGNNSNDGLTANIPDACYQSPRNNPCIPFVACSHQIPVSRQENNETAVRAFEPPFTTHKTKPTGSLLHALCCSLPTISTVLRRKNNSEGPYSRQPTTYLRLAPLHAHGQPYPRTPLVVCPTPTATHLPRQGA